MSRPTILLNPGPVTLSDRVRQSLLREDACHREPDFAQLMLDIKNRIETVYDDCQSQYDAVLLTGSGTCAVEAMLSTLAPLDSKTLVLANGVYGERMALMLEAQQKPFELIISEWPQVMDLAAAEEVLQNDSSVTHIAAVHNETTTGRLNDIDALNDLCTKYNKKLLLDAVSSFAGEHIDFKNWNVQAVAATANKCIHGIPGMAFVMVEKSVFEEPYSQSHTLYLDLFRYHKEQITGFSPFTQAVHACFALQEALMELEDLGGWQQRHARYIELSSQIRSALNGMSMGNFLQPEDYCSMISSFHLPEGWEYQRLHDNLREAGFVIYAGQGGLYHSIFRIANMGDIHDDDVTRLLETFQSLLA